MHSLSSMAGLRKLNDKQHLQDLTEVRPTPLLHTPEKTKQMKNPVLQAASKLYDFLSGNFKSE